MLWFCIGWVDCGDYTPGIVVICCICGSWGLGCLVWCNIDVVALDARVLLGSGVVGWIWIASKGLGLCICVGLWGVGVSFFL